MKYTYRHSHLWTENRSILDRELEELSNWLKNANIDTEFETEDHTYTTDSGDVWIFLPELTRRQLFTATLILSSSELYLDDKPVRFDTPPNKDQYSEEDL
jgi:hypothetical protein